MKERTFQQIGYSPKTGKVFIGKVSKDKPLKWIGRKVDITSDFIEVLLQKFAPGTERFILVNDNPKYTITVDEIHSRAEETVN